jgi:hypothetical protein
MIIETTAKLLLAASLSFGAILTVQPVPAQAEDSVETQIVSATQAISRANALNLIPEGARAAAKLSGEDWFRTDEKDEAGSPLHVGQIVLHAKNGKVARYSASLRSDFRGKPDEDPFDESKMKFSTGEAKDIALEYIKQKDWKLDVSWMFNPYTYEYDSRFEIPRLHGIHFDRSHDGIRDGSGAVGVTVDRWTGEVDSYYVNWGESTYFPDKVSEANVIGINEAGNLLFNAIEPFLKWQDIMDPEQPKLVYALHEQYVMTFDGKIPAEYRWENPAITEKIIPSYSSELAKKRLLSMYELGLEYVDGKLAYKLRLKPEITSFMSSLDWPPVIDAHTGEWLDFLNQPLKKSFSPADEWLIHAAPDSQIEYAAAILWDNELLQLQNEPYIKNGYTLVPFRELLTKLGAKINWDPVARKVTASKDGTTIELTIDSDTTVINGKEQKLEAPAVIKDERTYIPARLVLETFDVNVGWNNESRLVLVSTDGYPLDLSSEELKKHRFQAQLNWENKMHK